MPGAVHPGQEGWARWSASAAAIIDGSSTRGARVAIVVGSGGRRRSRTATGLTRFMCQAGAHLRHSGVPLPNTSCTCAGCSKAYSANEYTFRGAGRHAQQARGRGRWWAHWTRCAQHARLVSSSPTAREPTTPEQQGTKLSSWPHRYASSATEARAIECQMMSLGEPDGRRGPPKAIEGSEYVRRLRHGRAVRSILMRPRPSRTSSNQRVVVVDDDEVPGMRRGRSRRRRQARAAHAIEDGARSRSCCPSRR